MLWLISTLVLLSQCKMEVPAPPDHVPVTSQFTKQLYDNGCAICHGPDGRGDTPMGRALDPRPQNLADPEWQKRTSDADIKNIIRRGGEAVGKSAAMPGNDLSEEELNALLKFIRLLKPVQ